MFEHGFPPYWSTIKKLIWLVGTGIVGGVTEIWKTVTGTLIHITDALASPMQKCEVTLEPIQDLHGQDAPYPAGGGGNLCPPLVGDSGYTGLSVTTNADGSLTVSGTATGSGYITEYANLPKTIVAGTTFIVSVKTALPVTLRAFFDQGVADVGAGNTSGGSTTLNVDATKIRLYLFTQANTSYNFTIYFQLEEGSTVTPWKPYSNICPITGWIGCEVTRTGKNVLPNNYSDYTTDVAYAFITSLIPHNTPAIMSFTDRDTSVDVSGCYIGFILDHYSADPVTESRWCMSNGNISGVTNNTSAQNPSIFCNGVFIFPNNEETFNKIFSRYYVQVELGTTITDYEPYSGATLSVTFPDTVYGGSHEFVGGGLKSKKVLLTLNGNSTDGNYSRISSGRFNIDNLPINYLRNESAANSGESSQYKSLPQTSTNGKFDTLAANYSAAFNVSLNLSGNTLRIKDTRFDTVAELQAAYATEKPQFVLTLATPTEIQLTPQEISTLAGENNVWSNGDSVEITYKAQAS